MNEELFKNGMVEQRNVVDNLIEDNKIEVVNLQRKTEEARLYRKFTKNPDIGDKIIGSGEAAAIALAVVHRGILASCNYTDINRYIRKYNLKHTDIAETLYYALEHHYITLEEAEGIWNSMKKRRRRLPEGSFADYLKRR